MYLDYKKIQFDKFGRPEVPNLLLQTKDRRTIGIVPNAINLKFDIKFSEPSEISFDLPSSSDGKPTPFYDQVVGYKVIRTENYGVYQLMKPSIKGDGLEEIKSVTGYSIEKELEGKKFFLEEGTFNFWNPAAPDDTVLGRSIEVCPGWSVGYVAPSLIGRYRTFDQYDDYVLTFLYNNAMETYRCVIVFDPYNLTISAYDADDEVPTLPIYLGFDNLVEELSVDELTDELVTAMNPTGADDLDIRAVNPIGTNWIYDISYFIENGDIEPELAEKWREWQKSVLNRQEYYKGLVGMQASATARLLTEQAKLTDLNGEKDDLTNQQSVTVQALALEVTDNGKQEQQAKLDEINASLDKKKEEIKSQETVISEIKDELDADKEGSYPARIKAINDELKLTNVFTAEEYATLQHYFIEQDLSDETFVASDVDAAISGNTTVLKDAKLSIANSKLARVDFSEVNKTMYTIAEGNVVLKTASELTADIIRGTLECKSDNTCMLSLYCGTIKVGDSTNPSGLITISGQLSNLSTDVHEVVDQEVTTYEGTSLSFTLPDASCYMTTNVSDYQKYSVQMELYDHAVETLSEVATPTYEFSVDSGNFIFAQEFQPFRKELELGKGIYLRLHNDEVITPVLIEFELDFEDREKLSLTFSNRFKRHDSVQTLKNMIEQSYSSSRSFDAAKYIYNQTSNQASKVSEFMNSSLNAAANAILGAKNQSVRIDGAGLHIGGDSNYQIRIVDSMICMSDDGFKTAKVAIGRFATEGLGEYWGINTDILGGKLLIGNNLIIEAPNDHGVMQFKVDSTGAWLYNSQLVLASDKGGKFFIHPEYGIAAGSGNLYTTDGTTVKPSFIDDDGNIIFDDSAGIKDLKIPKNTNFYIDATTGKAYFRGNVYADNGVFNGTVYATDGEFSGELKGAKGTFTGTVSAGTIYASNIQGGKISGTLEADPNTGGALKGVSLDIGNGNFTVDSSGNVVIKSGNISWGAVTGTDAIDQKISDAQSTADSAKSKANSASSTASKALTDLENLANGDPTAYITGTFINGHKIESPEIEGNNIIVNGYFQTKNSSSSSVTGYMGAMNGEAANNTTTYGVGISARLSGGTMVAPYIIVTNAGIRLQASGQKLVVTSSGVEINDVKLGTAVFG